ncbi:hypothetical protein BGZ63DRAFT_409481 [Mariannaea sp. PMI_226]|nr:hypothetical protein BGZ63DRAFT_409481 [Mariannaea sp. PMI_226]
MWIRKHVREGSTACSNTQGSLQNSTGQGYRTKAVKPVGPERSLPGNPDNRAKSETCYKQGFQCHRTSNLVWEILKPDLAKPKENTKPHIQKMQYTTSPCPTHLQLLELPPPPPPPPPNTPLPEIPIHARHRIARDWVGEKVQNRQVPTRTPPYIGRTGRAKGSLQPEHIVQPPRTTSMAYSSRSYEKSHKPQQLHCPNNITTKHCHRHIGLRRGICTTSSATNGGSRAVANAAEIGAKGFNPRSKLPTNHTLVVGHVSEDQRIEVPEPLTEGQGMDYWHLNEGTPTKLGLCRENGVI